jgi:hypothetical protein
MAQYAIPLMLLAVPSMSHHDTMALKHPFAAAQKSILTFFSHSAAGPAAHKHDAFFCCSESRHHSPHTQVFQLRELGIQHQEREEEIIARQ